MDRKRFEEIVRETASKGFNFSPDLGVKYIYQVAPAPELEKILASDSDVEVTRFISIGLGVLNGYVERFTKASTELNQLLYPLKANLTDVNCLGVIAEFALLTVNKEASKEANGQ